MRKNITYLFFIYAAFELIKETATQIRFFARGQALFTWLQDTKVVGIVFSNFGIFFLYALLGFIIFDRFYQKNKSKTLLFFIVAVSLIITVRYFIQEILFPAVFNFENYENETLLFYYIDNLYYAIIYSFFGLVYFFVLNERKRMDAQSKLVLENKQAQLSFLQAQINPHFLFNSLNNIYSMVYYKVPQSLQAISGLSDILRYMLYDTNDRVSLAKEILYIKKYISFQSLRFPSISVQQEFEGAFDTIFIPPSLLIPFVENAFKHGDFSHAGVHLKVSLTVQENQLHFRIENRINNSLHASKEGIGLENIQKRLGLLFPEKHTLVIEEKDRFFIVDLQITFI